MIPPLKLDHLKRMTDDFGLFQFASGISPNSDYGYTLDDNARALILCSWLINKKHSKDLDYLSRIYFNFIKNCFQNTGFFINYLGLDKAPTGQNTLENLEDVQSRALWALGEVISNKMLSLQMREEAKKIYILSLKNVSNLTHLRSQAFAIKAFSLAINFLPEHKSELLEYIKKYADSLLHSLAQHSDSTWIWFENGLSYSNGLLSEGLLIAGEYTNNIEYTNKGIASLRFLIRKTFSEKMYHPIGNSLWHKKDQQRSYHDQQPEDPASMILALISAYHNTQNEEYTKLAQKCFSWFLGNNSSNIPLYDEESGGCHDGLRATQINADQGAESLISYLMARVCIEKELVSK